jgi:toxin ParE1/3/4
VQSLKQLPQRGHVPHEIEGVGESTVLEIIAGYYRIIYELSGKEVTVFAVFDGRQDVRTHLMKRKRRLISNTEG